MNLKIKNYKIKNLCRTFGFTMVETILVIAITATLSVVGIGYYMNTSKAKILDRTAQEIVSLLKYAQQSSVSQKSSEQWGVHFENPSQGRDFYALYTGTTYSSAIETHYLPEGIEFEIPASGNSVDISFAKLTGTNYSGTNQSIVIKLTSLNSTTSISVYSQGLITY